MSDPRKGQRHDPKAHPPRHLSAQRIAQICNHLDRLSASTEVSKAARRIAGSIRKNEDPDRDDLAMVLLEVLYRRVQVEERRIEKSRKNTARHKASKKKPPQGSKGAPPSKTGFSADIEQVDQHRRRRRKIKKKLRIGPESSDEPDGSIAIPGDSLYRS